jgi:hypothetical protein
MGIVSIQQIDKFIDSQVRLLDLFSQQTAFEGFAAMLRDAEVAERAIFFQCDVASFPICDVPTRFLKSFDRFLA